MSGGVKLGYIEAGTNKLAVLLLAMDLEDGTEQSEQCSRTVRMKKNAEITTCRAAPDRWGDECSSGVRWLAGWLANWLTAHLFGCPSTGRSI